MIIVLWFYWKYFSSNRGQKAGSGLGIYYFRAVALSRAIWKWGLFGAFLFVLIVQASFVVTFCFIEFPVEKFTADYKVVDTMPPGVAWAVIILSSVVAGICEETGFRGYMQVPLEKRYGPTRAIIITSMMFMLMHLNHRWAFTILPHIFCASVLLGMLAFRSGSLLPGIIGHSILDIFDYSVWWTDLTGNYKRPTIFKSGVNLHFILWVLILGAALWGFFIVLDRLKKHHTPPDIIT